VSERVAGAFNRFVRKRSDAELAALMEGWLRRPLLWSIFRFAPRRLDRQRAAAGEAALIEIRVRDRRRGRCDRRQLIVGRGRCTVSRHDLGEPDSTVSFEPVAFLRFVAGQQAARELFLGRRISVDGSLLLAAELPSLFRIRARAG
jgi:predicted lipid carrier protein YhbT